MPPLPYAVVEDERDAALARHHIDALPWAEERAAAACALNLDDASLADALSLSHGAIRAQRFRAMHRVFDLTELEATRLASSSYLNTSPSTGTPFQAGNWQNALNKWWDGTAAYDGTPGGKYILTWSPNYVAFKNYMVYDIDHDFPFVIDVWMSDDTCYLAGWPDQDMIWKHYLAVRGYASSGDVTRYLDPFDTGLGSLGAHDVSTMGIIPCLQDRGMIW